MSLGKQIQLTIPKPCHQDFDTMPRTSQGMHCGLCERDIIDFTSMSDDDFRIFLLDTNFKLTCGVFRNDQLDKPIFIEKPTPVFSFTFLRKIAAAVFLLPLSLQQVFAQKKHSTYQVVNEKSYVPIVVEGKVVYQATNFPMSNIDVSLLGQHTITNEEGKFRFEVPASNINETVLIHTKIGNGLYAEDYKLDISNHISYNAPILIYVINEITTNQVIIETTPLRVTEEWHTAGVPLLIETAKPLKVKTNYFNYKIKSKKKKK
jgi:hypothetical protein